MARKITIEFLGDSKDLQRAMGDADRASGKLSGALGKVGKAAAVGLAAGAVVAAKGLFDATQAAGDLNETLSKTQAIFGKRDAKQLDIWSDDTARQLGMSKQATLDAAATFGIFGKAAGKTGDELQAFAQMNTALAADLASFNNTSPEEAVEALGAAFRGEAEPLRSYGVLLDDATMRQAALQMGLIKTTKDALTPQQKVLAAQQVIMQQTSDAQGDFHRTSGSLANQQKILKAELANTSVELGQKLLPAGLAVVTFLNQEALPAFKTFGGWLSETLPPIFERVRTVVTTVMGGMQGDIGGSLGKIKAIFSDAVSIISSLWDRFGSTLIDAAVKTFANVKQIIGGALTVVQGIFQTFSSLLKGDWEGAWDGIKKILSGAFEVIKGIVKQALNVVGTLFEVGWSAVKGITSALWDGIKTVVSNGVSNIVGWISDIPGKLRDKIGSFRDAGASLIGAFVDGMKNAGGVIEGIASNVWNAVRGLLNSAIDKINAALEFTISLPGPDITINPTNIPHLAKGGIVNSPTLALIGEDGPEAVVPLSRKHNPGGSMPGAGGGNIIVHISGALDPVAVGRQMEQILATYTRSTGRPLQVSTQGA